MGNIYDELIRSTTYYEDVVEWGKEKEIKAFWRI